jgi:uncharacterized protein YbaR (Trm112 family)
MDASFLDVLRCPIDPLRETSLNREEQALVCRQCKVHFPIRQGIPILVLREAEFPANIAEASQLPCVRRRRARKRGH